MYPILFAAAEYLADPKNGVGGKSVFGLLRDRIVEANGLEDDDEDGVRSAVLKARRKLGPTLTPLNEEALRVFGSPDDGEIGDFLAGVKDTTRSRLGACLTSTSHSPWLRQQASPTSWCSWTSSKTWPRRKR